MRLTLKRAAKLACAFGLALALPSFAKAESAPSSRHHVVLQLDGSRNKLTLRGFGELGEVYGHLEEFIRYLAQEEASLTISLSNGDNLSDTTYFYDSLNGEMLDYAIANAKELWADGSFPDVTYGVKINQALTLAMAFAPDIPATLIFFTASSDEDPYLSESMEAEIASFHIPVTTVAFCESENGLNGVKGVAVTPDDQAYLTRLADATGGKFYDIDSVNQISSMLIEGVAATMGTELFQEAPAPSPTPEPSKSPSPTSAPAPTAALAGFTAFISSQIGRLSIIAAIIIFSIICAWTFISWLKTRRKRIKAVAAPSPSESPSATAASPTAPAPMKKKMMLQVMSLSPSIPYEDRCFNAVMRLASSKENLHKILIDNGKEWAKELVFDEIWVRIGSDGELELQRSEMGRFEKWKYFKPYILSVKDGNPDSAIQFRYYRG